MKVALDYKSCRALNNVLQLSQKCELQCFVFQKVPIWQQLLANQVGGFEYKFRCLNWFFRKVRRKLRPAFFLKLRFLKIRLWWDKKTPLYLQNSKIHTIGKRKKMYFSIISYQEFLLFPLWPLSEMFNVSSEYSFRARSHDILVSWTFDLLLIISRRYLVFRVYFSPGNIVCE